MALFERLIGTEEPKIAIHKFHAVIDEMKQGRLTQAQAKQVLGLSNQEASEALTVLNTVTTEHQFRRMFNYLILGELGVTTPRDYTSRALFVQALPTF